MAERSYLDWNATASLRPEAYAAMDAALALAGNPSSVHGEGRAARALIERARAQVAALLGAQPRGVIFTSGGTEANALALSPATGGGCTRLLVSAVEHPSVMAGGRFAPAAIAQVPVTPRGEIDLGALERMLAEGGRALVSLMLANNETGVIQPVAQAAALVRAAGGMLHVDAVQAAGKIPCDINTIGADLVTISAHKIGGPKGIGALVRRSEALQLDPLIRGGGQEGSVRSGTENVSGIAGFGAAAQAVQHDGTAEAEHTRRLRDALEARLCDAVPTVIIYGSEAARLPNTSLFAVPGIKAETAVIALDLAGVAVSSGAACSSGKVQSSHVLAAMGVTPEAARGAIRVSIGPTTTEADVEALISAWMRLCGSLLKGRRDIAA